MTTQDVGDKAEEPQVVVEPTLSPKEELDTLRQELTATKDDLVRAQDEAKAHQKVVSKKDQELQKSQEISSRIENIDGRIDLLEGMIAELGERGSGEGEAEKPFGARARELSTQREREGFAQKTTNAERQITDLLKDTGLTRESPELKAAGYLWSLGTQTNNPNYLEDCIKEVKEIAEKLPKPETKEGKKETEEERINRIAEEKLKEKMIEAGLLTSEGGQPSGGGGVITRESIAEGMSKPKSAKELQKDADEVFKAFKEGKIK